jgi:hypothetical protein
MDFDIEQNEHLLGPNLITYDPYDLWKTRTGQWLKKIYYKKGATAIPLVGPFVALDLFLPRLVRFFSYPQEYPTVRALAAMAALNYFEITRNPKYVNCASVSVKWLIDNQSPGYHGACWGLNMPWMTKTGYCPPTMPFITHTPYCVEALIRYSEVTKEQQVLDVALSSLEFLEKDIVALLDNSEELALSYGPSNEGRIVVNANAYAAMMYALFANKLQERKEELRLKATRIFNFIKSRQNKDGSWYYYEDDGHGNFIDCFHSCFVIKNIIKYGNESGVDVANVVDKALDYIVMNFIDKDKMLAKRFTVSANPSFVNFDLYDQAELLNVLCISGRLDLASEIHDSILKNFYIPNKSNFGSQIDVFGRLNKMIYLRWAVMPTIYALSEYYKLLCHENY